jgi:hypothetical protein
MRIEILRQTSITGQPARVGDVVEVDPRDARLLIGSGKAKPAPAAVPEVQPLAEDPKPTTRKPRTRRSKIHGNP